MRLANDHYVCMSPLTREFFDSLDVDGLGDDFGYFVYESQGAFPVQSITVLAKCPSYEAAARLMQIYGSAARAPEFESVN